jgi:hypothetical protein
MTEEQRLDAASTYLTMLLCACLHDPIPCFGLFMVRELASSLLVSVADLVFDTLSCYVVAAHSSGSATVQ